MIQDRNLEFELYESDHRINVQLDCKLGLQVGRLNDGRWVCQTWKFKQPWFTIRKRRFEL